MLRGSTPARTNLPRTQVARMRSVILLSPKSQSPRPMSTTTRRRMADRPSGTSRGPLATPRPARPHGGVSRPIRSCPSRARSRRRRPANARQGAGAARGLRSRRSRIFSRGRKSAPIWVPISGAILAVPGVRQGTARTLSMPPVTFPMPTAMRGAATVMVLLDGSNSKISRKSSSSSSSSSRRAEDRDVCGAR
jgi:hypothetical protein